MTERLYVAAKAPRPGFVKTRLGRRLGDGAATGLYRAFLIDLSSRLRALPISTGWFVTPDDGWCEVSDCVGGGWSPAVRQGAGSWGVRQDRLFRTAQERCESRVVLIASDSPQVGLDLIEQAFSALDSHDLVFGPVLDGGYWLIGMTDYAPILGEMPMSTATVLADLLAAAAARRLPVHLLEPVFDVDEVSDLDRLSEAVRRRADLTATSAALAALAVTA